MSEIKGNGRNWMASLPASTARGCSLLLALTTVVILSGWFVGDGGEWTKWLSWVPAVLLIPLPLLGLLLCWWFHGRGPRLLRITHGVLLSCAGSILLVSDIGILRHRSVKPSDQVVVHWNASWPNRKIAMGRAYDCIRETEPDLLIVTEVGQFGWGIEGAAFRDRWPYEARPSGTLILSRSPISSARTVLYRDGVSLIEATMEIAGGEGSIWIVDLPSDPMRSRPRIFSELLQAAAGQGLAPPDLVVGDFNVTRRSRTLHEAFPRMNNAFDESGVGWYGSWPREWPLWQLDQMLLGPGIESRRYELVDPGVGRHLMQRAVLRDTRSD